MASQFGARKPSGGLKVLLNVYDLWENNEIIFPLGFGAFHSGIEIGGREYSFAGGAGVFVAEPKTAPNAKFRESIEMGTFEGTMSQAERIAEELRSEGFSGEGYNIITRNCNHFSEAFCQRLVRKPIPGFVNRLAFIGSFFECLLPGDMTSQAPVAPDGSSGNSGVSGTGFQVYAPSNSSGQVVHRRPAAFQGTALTSASAVNTPAETADERRERIRKATLDRMNKT